MTERDRERCRGNLAATRNEWTWSQVTAPLVEDLPGLPAAPKGSLLWATARAGMALLGYARGGHEG